MTNFNEDLSLGLNRSQYPSPFFDSASMYMPPTMEELLKWCRYFYLTDGTIRTVVSKMSQYPVTNLIFEGEGEKTGDSRALREYLENDLDIYTMLVSIGEDYFSCGNAYVIYYKPFRRFLACECGHQADITSFGKVRVQAKKPPASGTNPERRCLLKWQAACPRCQRNAEMRELKVLEGKTRFIQLDPLQVSVKLNPLSGSRRYQYKIDKAAAADISTFDVETLATTPDSAIEACISAEATCTMDVPNLFHFQRHGGAVGGIFAGYGIPLILPALKLVYYQRIMRRHQEAIAHEHIVPMRILFPTLASGGASPLQHASLPSWVGQAKQQINRWRQDPNDVYISSVPMGVTQIGGDARGLFVTPELQLLRREIINSMDVPVEFVEGGMQWSGSSVSLRMLENQFISYRKRSLRFLRWVLNAVAPEYGGIGINVRMADFKMSDDIQRKQQIEAMTQNGWVSKETLMKEMGLDFLKEKEASHRERMEEASMSAEIASIQQRAQSKNFLESQIAQMDAQRLLHSKGIENADIAEKARRVLPYVSPDYLPEFMRELQKQNPEAYSILVQSMYSGMQPDPQPEAVQPPPRPSAQAAAPPAPPGNGQAPAQPAKKPDAAVAKPLPEVRPPHREGGSPV